MVWLKARARDLVVWTAFVVMLYGCTFKREMCKGPYAGAPSKSDVTLPSQEELHSMACDCAADPKGAGDCTDDLWETREASDSAGCSNELDALAFCVEDGESCDKDSDAPWACEPQEAEWRECLGKDAKAAR